MCVNLHLPSYGLYGNLLIEPMNHCHRLNRADFLFYNKASIVARKKKKKKQFLLGIVLKNLSAQEVTYGFSGSTF